MGIYLCESDTEPYEPKSPSQSGIYLSLAFIYLIVELYYIYHNIQLFRRISMKNHYSLVLFCICVHLIFLRRIFTSLGGVLLCYGMIVREFFYYYFPIFKDLMILIITYRIGQIIAKLRPSSKLARICPIIMSIVCIAYFSLMNVVFIFSQLKLIDEIIVAVFYFIFVILSTILFNTYIFTMMNINKSPTYINEKYKWRAVVLIFDMSYIFRIFNEILLTMELIAKKDRATIIYSIIMFVYYTVTEMLPAFVIVLIISGSNKRNNRMIESQSSRESDMSDINDTVDG